MTPLASRLAKQLVAPRNQADPYWRLNKNLLKKCLSDIHCFEVTEALQMVPELKRTIEDRFGKVLSESDIKPEQSEFIGQLVFLPAPKTWIEYKHSSVWRIGLLVEEFGPTGRVTLFTEKTAGTAGLISLVSDDWEVPPGLHIAIPQVLKDEFRQLGKTDTEALSSFLKVAHTCLILINSPKIIGRRQIMPNAGLERRLTKGLGVGNFPLHAWTEIKLHVTKPIEIDDGEPHEAHLTGRRALHFCRKHIRIRFGKLEYVSAHWRGDPAIGIKQSRYAVVP